MVEPKTKLNNESVSRFLNSIKDDQVREDCWTIADIMQKATRAKPKMWGASIVGFGTYRCTYANGREADWMVTAFSPRKQNITLYLMGGFPQHDELMAALGKHSCGKSCVYIKRLSDVDVPTLKKLVNASAKHVMKSNSAGSRSS
jgi:hypothetical protein